MLSLICSKETERWPYVRAWIKELLQLILDSIYHDGTKAMELDVLQKAALLYVTLHTLLYT